MTQAEHKRVLLGMGAAGAFAAADLTSPAVAGMAGALVDTGLDSAVTELRIHGVSGSNGPVMLEHPQALQVAGDAVTGFYRRWSPEGGGRPSVPWKLEAYSWGGLTEAPMSSAAWIVLSPFMFFNVANFMLPPHDRATGRAHWLARLLLRLLALTATVQFVTAVLSFLISTVAWQATGISGAIPAWFGWYGRIDPGWRVAIALLVLGLVVLVLWWLSVRTASRYEAKTTSFYQQDTQRPDDSSIARDKHWTLSRPGFWAGDPLIARQRRLHAGAATAAAALLAALPAIGTGLGRLDVAVSGVVLLGAALLVFVPALDWEHTSQERADAGAPMNRWCRLVAAGGAVALVLTAATAPSSYPPVRPGALPGTTGFFSRLLIGQGALLVILGVVVFLLAAAARRRANAPADGGTPNVPGDGGTADVPGDGGTANVLGGAPAAGNVPGAADPEAQRPYFFGLAAWLMAGLGVVAGGVLTAVLNVALARLMGTPVPSGFTERVADQIVLPKEMYALVAAAWGLGIGLLAGAALVAVQYFRYRGEFLAGRREPALTEAYPDIDEPAHTADRKRIASAWAVGLLVDNAAIVLTVLLGGAVAGFAGAEIALSVIGDARHPALLHSPWGALVRLGSLFMWLLGAALLVALRSAYRKVTTRRTIGAIWDVATFWPRAVHPFAPPCYGERAVPELVDRVRLLTGQVTEADPAWLRARTANGAAPPGAASIPTGPLLLTGYSQGTIIATAVLAQLNEPARRSVALLTMGCPVRRLYGRAFPAYFGGPGGTLRTYLEPCRWQNLVRATDYIGSWVEHDPLTPAGRPADPVDVVCLDPPRICFDRDPTPPPIHRHSDFWPDPAVRQVGAALVDSFRTGPGVS